jgi:hypothetical protein
MLSTLHDRENDPHDALEIAPDVVFAARADRPFPTLAPDAIGHAADPQGHIGSSAAAPSLDATFRATAADNRHVLREPSQARAWAKRALVGFLFAIGSAFAAVGWQHYGDHATAVIADWMPRFALTSPAPANSPESASPPVLQAAAVTEASSQATSPAQALDAGAEPASASDQTQLIQSMARDVATMGQQIERLKASITELKAGQEQMSREIAKTAEARASESSLRPRPSPPPRPAAAAPTRKPRPTFSAAQPTPSPLPSPQSAPAPAPPQTAPAPQATTQPDGEPVVRPPMPLR